MSTTHETTDTTTSTGAADVALVTVAREYARTVATEQRTSAERIEHLGALLAEQQDRRREAFEMPRTTNLDNVARTERLALICARITGLWRLIVAHATHDLTVPDVYRHAAVLAECDARDTARFWRDTARDWRARAERRPTSDAAGALSNWHELGVTA